MKTHLTAVRIFVDGTTHTRSKTDDRQFKHPSERAKARNRNRVVMPAISKKKRRAGHSRNTTANFSNKGY